MDFSRFIGLELITEAFSFGMMQDYVQMTTEFEAIGITYEEVKQYVEIKSELVARFEDRVNKAHVDVLIDDEKRRKKCPICGADLEFDWLNTRPCNQVKGYRSVMFCPNEECWFEPDYSKQTLVNLLRTHHLYNSKHFRAKRRRNAVPQDVEYRTLYPERDPVKRTCRGCDK